MTLRHLWYKLVHRIAIVGRIFSSGMANRLSPREPTEVNFHFANSEAKRKKFY